MGDAGDTQPADRRAIASDEPATPSRQRIVRAQDRVFRSILMVDRMVVLAQDAGACRNVGWSKSALRRNRGEEEKENERGSPTSHFEFKVLRGAPFACINFLSKLEQLIGPPPEAPNVFVFCEEQRAERVRFELTRAVKPYQFSRLAPSTTRPPFRKSLIQRSRCLPAKSRCSSLPTVRFLMSSRRSGPVLPLAKGSSQV